MHIDMEILDTDKKVGLINQAKITKATKIPEEEGMEGTREQID
jgi:hypothetical protein